MAMFGVSGGGNAKAYAERSGYTQAQEYGNIVGLEEALKVAAFSELAGVNGKLAVDAHGLTLEEFVDLMSENRVLTPSEAKIVQSVREYIGLPEEGTVMSKTVPQRELYRYLNAEYGTPESATINAENGAYTGVRGFVSVEEDSAALSTIRDQYIGNRLDYDGTAFRPTERVTGLGGEMELSKADSVYGKITYTLEEPETVSVPTYEPTPADAPYTGRGFTSADNIVLPEHIQQARPFVAGDMLTIYDAETGAALRSFEFEANKGWVLQEAETPVLDNVTTIEPESLSINNDLYEMNDYYERIFEQQYEVNEEYEEFLRELQPKDYRAKLKTEFIDRVQNAGVSFSDTMRAYEALEHGEYAEMAKYFNTDSPKDGAVFWSGDLQAAINYADSINGTVMEITPGGNVFNNWETLSDVYPSYKWGTKEPLDQKPIWEALSKQYAQGAEGDVSYVHPDGYYGAVWREIEYKELVKLINRGIVTNVNEVVIDGK